MSKRDELIKRSISFLAEVKEMTAGVDVERWLNKTHGPGSSVYDELAVLIKAGIEEGWAANVEISGSRYRRSRICEPSPETFYFSITAVYMDSRESGELSPEVGKTFRGDYHAHPYGELNMVIPLTDGAMLAGPNGWCGAGWTAPAPGSHHYPEVKGGALIALFFLPAGRISYDIQAPAEAC
ncbi:hypothetical protein GCM10011396_40080 [Undibacterium terreum]|uniref:p-hydroxylaminobenzoate lyase n=1 Tax=Undibacterium terreum TaxID=1224302 RepID=A0A916XPK5_9BURK|nr:hypothetical protein GCM10011396_40080 [Undibacterium terreum]